MTIRPGRALQKSACALRAQPSAGWPQAGRALARLLLVALLAAAPAHATEPEPSSVDPSRTATAGGLDSGRGTQSARPANAAPSTSTGPQPEALATLSILALGIIGLLWVRRHVAEL